MIQNGTLFEIFLIFQKCVQGKLFTICEFSLVYCYFAIINQKVKNLLQILNKKKNTNFHILFKQLMFMTLSIDFSTFSKKIYTKYNFHF